MVAMTLKERLRSDLTTAIKARDELRSSTLRMVLTAVTTEDNSPAIALIAALLAVGVAVPLATAARMRRLERAQR